jgi:hypothetical protein
VNRKRPPLPTVLRDRAIMAHASEAAGSGTLFRWQGHLDLVDPAPNFPSMSGVRFAELDRPTPSYGRLRRGEEEDMASSRIRKLSSRSWSRTTSKNQTDNKSKESAPEKRFGLPPEPQHWGLIPSAVLLHSPVIKREGGFQPSPWCPMCPMNALIWTKQVKFCGVYSLFVRTVKG